MTNQSNLISTLPAYYKKSQTILEDFGGPSIYFHLEAIKAQREAFLSPRHLEMTYATLTAWGMHRMGDPEKVKARLVDFAAFRGSILKYRDELELLRKHRIEDLDEAGYAKALGKLEAIYRGLVVSESEATIVAHSKALAHLLPDLIAPIDRQYTVRFFTQADGAFLSPSGTLKAVALPKGIDRQFTAFENYSLAIKRLYDACVASGKVSFVVVAGTLDSSIPKIMDNLIMSFVKEGIRKARRGRQAHGVDTYAQGLSPWSHRLRQA